MPIDIETEDLIKTLKLRTILLSDMLHSLVSIIEIENEHAIDQDTRWRKLCYKRVLHAKALLEKPVTT